MTNDSAIYRLDIRYPANRGGTGTKFRLMVTADKAHAGLETVAKTFSTPKPTMPAIHAWLAQNGFEAYGDLKIMSDGTLRSMVKKIS